MIPQEPNTCDFCGEESPYDVCTDCRTPDYGTEEVNENVGLPS